MFYKYNAVDIASTKSMWNFLKSHATHSDHHRDFAANMKLYNLNLRGDWTNVYRRLEADDPALLAYMRDLIADFCDKHKDYKVGFYGRSGGWLHLVHVPDYTKSFFLSSIPDWLDYRSYEEFKQDIRANDEYVKDYKYSMQDVVEVVRDFDRLCDQLRDLADCYSVMDARVIGLEEAIDNFNWEYDEELLLLETEPLEIVNDTTVSLAGIVKYRSLMQALTRLLMQHHLTEEDYVIDEETATLSIKAD